MGARRRGSEEAQRFWAVDSTPFAADPPPAQPCRIVLRQVSDNEFALQERVVVAWPLGTEGGPPPGPLVIEPAWLPDTDLASVPDYLGWFARRFGRHTPAALVHDLLNPGRDEPWPPGLPEGWRLPPERADLAFRRLLTDSGVPPVRAFLMWAAAAARTRWRSGWAGALSLVLWGVAAVAGSATLVAGLVDGDAAAVAVALVAPAVAALLWGREVVAGLVAGYSLWWIVFGSLPAWLAYRAYQVVEWVVWRLRCASRRRRGVPIGVQPAPPVRYPSR